MGIWRRRRAHRSAALSPGWMHSPSSAHPLELQPAASPGCGPSWGPLWRRLSRRSLAPIQGLASSQEGRHRHWGGARGPWRCTQSQRGCMGRWQREAHKGRRTDGEDSSCWGSPSVSGFVTAAANTALQACPLPERCPGTSSHSGPTRGPRSLAALREGLVLPRPGMLV